MQLLHPRFWMSQFFMKAVRPKQPKNINQIKRALQIATKDKQEELEASGILDENVKQQPYTHTSNYNFETYLKYTKLVQAEKQREQVQRVTTKRVPIYDRPKFDTSLNDYYVWTTFHNPYYKPHEFSELVVCKIYLSPKALIHAFGIGVQPWRNITLSTREFDFEDSNLDKFLLYDAKQTTDFWGPNRTDNFYNKQQYVRPIHRRQRWPTFQEFWNSDQKVPFRVNCTRHADFRRFKAWIQVELDRCAKLPSFEERVLSKYGPVEYYDDYNKQYQHIKEPSVFKYTRQYFLEKGQKLDPSNKQVLTQQRLNIPLQPVEHLGEEYRVPVK